MVLATVLLIPSFAAAYGNITISSVPSGATVLVDSVSTGATTPTTIEGISSAESLHPIQKSFIENGAIQCGYCTPGFVVTAKALLEKKPNPTENDCKQALAGNICCCGTYPRHPTAIMEAAQIMKGGA